MPDNTANYKILFNNLGNLHQKRAKSSCLKITKPLHLSQGGKGGFSKPIKNSR
jgi:hypothetical protein